MNKNGNAVVWLIIAILIVGAILYFYYPDNELPASTDGEGRVVFTLTDAAANIENITSVKVTINGVMAHSETDGWVTVSSTQRTYDLLQLKTENKEVVLTDTELKEGTYTQTRLDISKVIVIDSDGEHEAKLPSGELKIVGNLIVDANTTSTVKFDFIADESLHITGNNKYIFAPVVQLETRTDVDLDIKSDNSVEVSNGRIVASTKVGMDINGNVGVGLKIPSNANLGIGSNGQVSLGNSIGVGLGL